MFTLENDKLVFIHIRVEYIEALHKADKEVSFAEKGYENKPYIALLLSHDGYQYAIPLTSAKLKHKDWPDVSEEKDRFLVYEMVNQGIYLGKKAIIQPGENQESKDKHILAAIDLKKMIPVRREVTELVNINLSDSDNPKTRKYKVLLNKEFQFCRGIKQEILKAASELYDKQDIMVRANDSIPFCCNFKLLETVSDNYIPKD